MSNSSALSKRLDDPSRNWKISEGDYSERELWPQYVDAYEDAMALTSTRRAPWYVIPSNHKWIRRKYHAAEREEKGGKRRTKDAKKAE